MTSIPSDHVYVCPRCGALWIADAIMYEETDRCPRCGRYNDAPLYDGMPIDADPQSDLQKLFIYSMTGGALKNSDRDFMLTTGTLRKLDYVR